MVWLSCGDDDCDPDRLVEINIEEITVKSFSNLKPTGEVWDDSPLESEYPADLVIAIGYPDTIVWQSEIYVPNVKSPTETIFSHNVSLTNMDENFTISVWDMDDVENEFIGSVSQSPRLIYQMGNCLPSYSLVKDSLEVEIIASYVER